MESRSKKYDLIVVLGYEFDHNYQLPAHVYPRLEKAAELYHKGIANKIALSGKWSMAKDHQGITPPVTEAEKMRDYLIPLGVPEEQILLEKSSKDTIGNAYFLKNHLIKKNNYTRLLVLCADYHLFRVQHIFHKVFGPEYFIEYYTTPTDYHADEKFIQQQRLIHKDQTEFLKSMQPGDDSYLEDKLYTHPFYQKKGKK